MGFTCHFVQCHTAFVLPFYIYPLLRKGVLYFHFTDEQMLINNANTKYGGQNWNNGDIIDECSDLVASHTVRVLIRS
jgi:hypothetical protein